MKYITTALLLMGSTQATVKVDSECDGTLITDHLVADELNANDWTKCQAVCKA